MDKKYTIIVKTGEAEIRAIENTEKTLLQYMFPVIEITRGRKTTKDGVERYPFDKKLTRIKKVFEREVVCFDLTSDESLSSEEIDFLYNPTNGYQNWVDFMIRLKEECNFKEIIPALILNMEDDNFNDNLLLQVQNLKSNFQSILYRNSISDENCYDDFEFLKEELKDVNFHILLDCGYSPQASFNNVGKKSIARINNIKSILGDNPEYIICSNSFPNNVSEIGNEDKDIFSISEIDIYDLVSKEIAGVTYGDYASINPKRNDTITMARGWIPRIDVPLCKTIYYYKQRRPKGVTAYASTYTHVAQSVVSDCKFPTNLNCWGIKQIISCANGEAPSASPSFWISVRMNIHIVQQIKRIYTT